MRHIEQKYLTSHATRSPFLKKAVKCQIY